MAGKWETYDLNPDSLILDPHIITSLAMLLLNTRLEPAGQTQLFLVFV